MFTDQVLTICPPQAGDGTEATAQKKTRLTASGFLGLMFAPLDRVAVLALNRLTGQAEQRVVAVEQAAGESFQKWLRYRNANGSDIYFGPNPIRPGSRTRTTQDIERIAAVWIDLDADGDAALATLQSSALVPRPNIVLQTSRGKYQCLWRVEVEGLTIAEGAALNRGLAATFGGDLASCDVAHVLRWPGYTNRKYTPPFWVQGERHSDRVYQLADFRLPLEVQQPRPERKVAGSDFIYTEPAPAQVWNDKREVASIDEVLQLAAYQPDGKKYVCPTCEHSAVTIDRPKAVYYCHVCAKGDGLGALARRVGRRLAG